METIECDHCSTELRKEEANIMPYGYRFCDDCSCLDEEEFEKLYGEN